MKKPYLFVITIASLLFSSMLPAQDSIVVLKPEMIEARQVLFLSKMDGWVFKQGNDPSWADPDLDTRDWIKLAPKDLTLDFADEKGKIEGWFRFRFKIDSSLAEIPLGWRISTGGGGLTLYLNGELAHKYGNPSSSPSEHQSYNSWTKLTNPVNLQPGKEYLLSFYHVDHQSWFLKNYTSIQPGVVPLIRLAGPELNEYIFAFRERENRFFMAWLVGLLVLSLLFWLIYLQIRREKTMLLIALTTTSLLIATWTAFSFRFITGWTEVLFSSLFDVSVAITVGLIPMIITNILTQRTPRSLSYIFWLFPLTGALTLFMFREVMVTIPLIASFVLSGIYLIKYRKKIQPIQWVVIAGLILTLLWMLVYFLYEAFFLNAGVIFNYLTITGVTLTLPVSLLIYISMRFKEILFETENNALEIVQLTEAKLAAELENHKILENQKQVLEVEVENRTAELKQSLVELKNAQNQLVQSEKMAALGELTAGIAHEIQNPLNFVNNFAEVSSELLVEMNEEIEKGKFKEVKAISEDIKQNLEKINHHGKRADSIVKGMLQHSRSNTGQKELTDINALADEYLRLSYHGLRAKDKSFNAKFETGFDPDLPKIMVIPQDIGRVMLNLINNAFYAVNARNMGAVGTTSIVGTTPTVGTTSTVETTHALSLHATHPPPYKPTVTVSTKNLGDHIEISVRDNGSGIPEEIKNKIFQPFFTTKPTGQGTGLGLSLSYDIVKAHGGEMQVNSAENEGTTFTLSLLL